MIVVLNRRMPVPGILGPGSVIDIDDDKHAEWLIKNGDARAGEAVHLVQQATAAHIEHAAAEIHGQNPGKTDDDGGRRGRGHQRGS